MKFMLMMNGPKGDGNWGVTNWAPQDFKAMVGFMKNFAKRLKEAGELVGVFRVIEHLGDGLAQVEGARPVEVAEDEAGAGVFE